MKRTGVVLIVAVGLVAIAVECIGLVHIVKTGTCASGGPYAIARQCPSGTGKYAALLAVGMTVAILCMVAAGLIGSGGLFAGPAVLLWSAEFLGGGLVMLLTAILGHNLGPGAKTAGYTVGAIFIPMGAIPLAIVIPGWLRGARGKQIESRSREADATVSRVDELQRYGNNQARIRITYSVQPQDEMSFEVSRETNAIVSHMPRSGDRARVRYDPRHHETFEVISSSSRSGAGATRAASYTPPPTTAPSLTPAATAAAAGLPWSPTTPASIGGTDQMSDHIARLKQLADLHASGALTESEFEREKAKILAES